VHTPLFEFGIRNFVCQHILRILSFQVAFLHSPSDRYRQVCDALRSVGRQLFAWGTASRAGGRNGPRTTVIEDRKIETT